MVMALETKMVVEGGDRVVLQGGRRRLWWFKRYFTVGWENGVVMVLETKVVVTVVDG